MDLISFDDATVMLDGHQQPKRPEAAAILDEGPVLDQDELYETFRRARPFSTTRLQRAAPCIALLCRPLRVRDKPRCQRADAVALTALALCCAGPFGPSVRRPESSCGPHICSGARGKPASSCRSRAAWQTWSILSGCVATGPCTPPLLVARGLVASAAQAGRKGSQS
jgi:hypothetical protein